MYAYNPQGSLSVLCLSENEITNRDWLEEEIGNNNYYTMNLIYIVL